MKRDHRLSSDCGGCGSEDPLLLHNAGPRSTGIYRRLCPSCVLQSHQASFCPVCFDLFDDSPSLPSSSSSSSSHTGVMCRSCHRLAHSSCAPPAYHHCPPCSNPNFLYFPPYLKKSKLHVDDSSSQSCDDARILDKDSARALLAAVRISAASMTKAANFARVEADKRVKEAAFAKKRAREALERVAYLASTKAKHTTLPNPNPNKASSVSPLPGHKIQPTNGADAAAFSLKTRIENQSGQDRIVKPVSASLATPIVPVPPPTIGASIEAKDVQNNSVQVE